MSLETKSSASHQSPMSQETKSSGPQPMSLDDHPEEEKMLELMSKDGEKIKVPRRIALMSELVKTMAEGDKEENVIPLPNVTSAVLRKVLDYCEHYVGKKIKEIEKPLKSTNMREIVPKWDAEFMKVDQDMLFALILAANYMDIKSLLDLCCACVATMIKDRTPEEIRKTFSITNDFTPEEEAQIIAENKWMEEP